MGVGSDYGRSRDYSVQVWTFKYGITGSSQSHIIYYSRGGQFNVGSQIVTITFQSQPQDGRSDDYRVLTGPLSMESPGISNPPGELGI